MENDRKYINQGFLVEGRVLLNNSEQSYDISGMITRVMFKDAFIENNFQLVVIDTMVTKEIMNIMRDNDFRVYLKIYAYNIADTDTAEESDNKDIAITETVFDDIIRIYDQPFVVNQTRVEEESADTNSEAIDKSAPFQKYRISGIPENDISINDGIINNIYGNCTTSDVVVNMLTSTAPNANIHIDPITNKERHNQILIPPGSITESLRFLDENYYIYNGHPMSFYVRNGEVYLYDILDSHSEGKILECEVLSYNATVNTEKIGMLTKDNNGNFKVIYRQPPIYEQNKHVTAHSTGSLTNYYGYDDNFNLSIRQSGNKDSYNKERYIWNPKRAMANEDMIDLSSMISESVKIMLSGASSKYIDPLLTIRINSPEYPGVEGDYLIFEAAYIFSSSDFIHYTDSIVLSCVKKKSK